MATVTERPVSGAFGERFADRHIGPSPSDRAAMLAAVGVIGVVFIGGILVGICIGGAVIWRKRRREAIDPVEHSHVTLRLG